jgi:hypothetical protein
MHDCASLIPPVTDPTPTGYGPPPAPGYGSPTPPGYGRLHHQVTDVLQLQVTDRLHHQVTDRLQLQVTDRLHHQVTDRLQLQVTDVLQPPVTDRLHHQVTDLHHQVTDQLHHRVTDRLHHQVKDILQLQVTDRLHHQVTDRRQRQYLQSIYVNRKLDVIDTGHDLMTGGGPEVRFRFLAPNVPGDGTSASTSEMNPENLISLSFFTQRSTYGYQTFAESSPRERAKTAFHLKVHPPCSSWRRCVDGRFTYVPR